MEQGRFERELKDLIDSAASAMDPGKRKQPASPPEPSKRMKMEHSTDSSAEHTNIHPSRLQLVSRLRRRDSAVSGLQPPLGPRIADITGTLRNAVQRQWAGKDNFAYEELLEKRRTEHLVNVDRYVPASTHPQARIFPYAKLPKKVRARILTLLLVSSEPIIIDFTWLRTFVNGHCRVPVVEKTIKISGQPPYSIPMEWNQLIQEVKIMQKDCLPFRPALEARGDKTRKRKAPCRGLSTGTLTVSRAMHGQAASILYGKNKFCFPWPSTAWMQLESFLATIGTGNVSHLRHIIIHVPLWHRGIKEDFLEGAILDLTSPASRLAVVKPPSRDRLLSAVAGSVQALSQAGNLATFALLLEHGIQTDHFSGRWSNNGRLIGMEEAEQHVIRKQKGIQLLRTLGDNLAQPVITLRHPAAYIARHDLVEFRARLAGVIREAEKYGWKVDQHLKGRLS